MNRIIITILSVVYISVCFSQIAPFTFEGNKQYPDGTRIAYFTVKGNIENIQAVYIQKEIVKIPGIYKFHIYAGDTARRCMVKCEESIIEMTLQNQINTLITTFNTEKKHASSVINFYCNILDISDFPQNSKTENITNYKNEVKNWVSLHQNEYNIMQQAIDEILNQ